MQVMSRQFVARRFALAAALAITTTVAPACGGGGGGSSPTTPTPLLQAPPPASSQPPAVNLNGLWKGTYTRDGASGTIRLLLKQDGTSVAGGDSITEDKERGGNILGSLSGNTLTFNLQFGGNCVRVLSGTATVATDTMTGTFSGGAQSCPEGPINNGKMTLTIDRPVAPPELGTTWWGGSPGLVGSTPGIFGANGWIWQFTQEGSNTNGVVDFSGSITEGPSGGPNVLVIPESTGTLTGTLTQDFSCSGSVADCTPHYFWRVAFSITLSGKCPTTLNGTDNPTFNGDPFVGVSAATFNGTVSGTTCNGPANGVGFALSKQ
jgi:hypothetical protein